MVSSETIPTASNVDIRRIQSVSEEARVTPIELFFDLVFVFAITQVTALDGRTTSLSRGLIRGLLVLSLLWWRWVGYAGSATSYARTRAWGASTMFAAMAAMFVHGARCPEAFDDTRGVHRPWRCSPTWPCASCISRSSGSPGRRVDPSLRGQLIRFTPRSWAARVVVGGIVTRGLVRRPSPGCRAGRGLRRHDPGRRLGLAAELCRALRRAARPDRDHRAGRVYRRDRPRRGEPKTIAWPVVVASVSDSRWRPVCGGPTSTSSPFIAERVSRRALGRRRERASPATPTATCICR